MRTPQSGVLKRDFVTVLLLLTTKSQPVSAYQHITTPRSQSGHSTHVTWGSRR